MPLRRLMTHQQAVARYVSGGTLVFWQQIVLSDPPLRSFSLLLQDLSLFATWEIRLSARHQPTRMEYVEEGQGDKHHRRVENVLVCFVQGNRRFETVRVFDKAEDDTDCDQQHDRILDIQEHQAYFALVRRQLLAKLQVESYCNGEE